MVSRAFDRLSVPKIRPRIISPSELASMARTKGCHCLTFLLWASIISLLSIASAFSPRDAYLINSGSNTAETLDPDHRIFTGDDHRFLTSTRSIQIEDTDSNLVLSYPLYRTARVFDHPAHYVFPITDRETHHLVRFHFHPIQTNYYDLFEAEFHVVANGFLLLRNYRVRSSYGFPVIKEFVIPALSDEIKIAFIPSEKSRIAFVNAIEVISAPKDLIADIAQFVDLEKNERINGLLRNGFETVHRVNVGGLKVTPFNDSLWRTWVTDDEYLISGGGSRSVHFGGHIKYQLGGASREVGPDNVYNTARVLRSSDHSVPNENITMSFEVEKGYSYMVRMHFCDIASVAAYMLYFNVYVNGNSAYENLDLSDISNGQLASPFYADFVVGVEGSSKLLVSVGPSNRSLPGAVDAILNGIEIWKMNNSMGSFDGEVCADFVWSSWRRERICALLPFVGAILLLLCASVFLQRRGKGYVGWSRLPVDGPEANPKSNNQLTSIKA